MGLVVRVSWTKMGLVVSRGLVRLYNTKYEEKQTTDLLLSYRIAFVLILTTSSTAVHFQLLSNITLTYLNLTEHGKQNQNHIPLASSQRR